MSDDNKTPANADAEGAMLNEIKETLVKDLKETLVKETTEEVKKHFAYKPQRLPAVAKSEEDRGSLAEWIHTIGLTVHHDERREKAFNLLNNKYTSKALNQGTTTAGGFTVPEEWAKELLQAEDLDTVFYPNNVSVYTMAGETMFLPVRDQTVTPSAGSSAFRGGVTVAAVSEANAPSSPTQTAFKQLELSAVKFLATTEISQELQDNSALTVGQIVVEDLKDTITRQIDWQIVNGSDLTGILGDASVKLVPRATTNEIAYADVAKMYSRFLPAARKRGFWCLSPYAYEQLLIMEDGAGRLVWTANMQAVDGPTERLFGLPIYVSDALPDLGTEGDVMLVDPKWYALGINQDIKLGVSTDFKFDKELIVYRGSARVGGKPKYTAPVKLRDGTNTVSGFVVLDNSTS